MSWLIENFFKIFEWILYLVLFLIAIFFTWEAIDKFYSRSTSIEKYEEEIKFYPTMTMCFKEGIWKYGRDFNMTYAIVTSYEDIEDKVTLKLGQNNLGISGGKLNMKEIYTEWEGYCYGITAEREIDGNYITIKIWSSLYELMDIKIYFTSEENSYGVTKRNWKDGEVYPVLIRG